MAALDQPFNAELKDISKQFAADDARATTPVSPELARQLIAARRERIANKTRELERERRGEMTRRAQLRKRAQLPAHIRSVSNARKIRMDHIARSVSEVGYVAMVKERLGRGMKDEFKWRTFEEGRPENQQWLDDAARLIEEQNMEKRTRSQGDH
jgi:hypothetical protein